MGPVDGFERSTFTFEGKERDVFRAGSGPAVIVCAEIPGITPKVIEFAQRVVDIGCTVALPHLFGEPGRDAYSGGQARAMPYVLSSMVPACISKEFTVLATGQTSPVVAWLRALARSLHEECGGPGVGAVGMCFTGNFALGMMVGSPVVAPVLSQPSLPFPIGRRRKRDLNITDAELEQVKLKCAKDDLTVLGLRFTGDKVVPAERFERLREELGDRFVAVEIDSSKGNPHGNPVAAHSVLAEHLIDEPGSPTRDALEQVLDLFRLRLLS
ncbi:MAG: dienelactone hydrolase family protein [Acidimicrobiales bacterium]